jgi:hypothetical protein
VAQLYHQALGFLSVTFYNLQGYSGGIRTCLLTSWNCTDSTQTAQKTLLPRIPPWLIDMLSGLFPSDDLGIFDMEACLVAVGTCLPTFG